jgi:Zn-finger nucleic acid-binding protein
MKCPVCQVDLLLNERQGVEIDYCPKCRGVWLDRGELEKLIERSSRVSYNREHGYDDDDYKHYHEYREHPDYHKRKRKGWLDDVFDFD